MAREIPDHDCSQQPWYDEDVRTVATDPEPRFPMRGNKVRVLGLEFVHEHRVTRGSDPYSGDEWKLRVGAFNLRLSNVICFTATVRLGRFECARTAYFIEGMPRWFVKLWNFLERRLEWSEWCDEQQCDDRRMEV